MSGLGIDLGSPLASSPRREQDRSIRAMSVLTSLNEFNMDRNTMHPSSYAASTKSDASNRHGRREDHARRETSADPASRNRRLSLAVRALQEHEDYDSASDALSEDSASPRTEASTSTAHTSDHASRFNHSKANMGRPQHMIRSQSTYSSSSELSLASGSSALGRSNATTKYAGRNSFRSKRLASAPNVHDLATHRGGDTMTRSQTNHLTLHASKSKESLPDGFGGYVDSEDDEGIEAGDTTVVPSDAESPSRALLAASTRESHARHKQVPSRPDSMPRSMSQPAHGTHHHAMTVSNSFAATQYRIGSLYGPDGRETGRILEDEEAYSTEEDESCVGGSEVSGCSSASRSSVPRSIFMSSPRAGNSAQRQQVSGSEVSGYSASAMSTSSSGSQVPGTVVTMRSERGWRGLSGAERGEAFISINPSEKTFKEGSLIRPRTSKGADNTNILVAEKAIAAGAATPYWRGQESAPEYHPTLPLDRNGTLISATAHPARRSKDLSRLLANSSGKLSSLEASKKARRERQQLADMQMPAPALEQSRPGKGRVDVDVVLESDLVVEGGLLNGRLEIKVRNQDAREERLMLTQPKVRVVGFEELLNEDTRHIFYHHSTIIDGISTVGAAPSQGYVLHGSPDLSPEMDNRRPLACFASPPDAEGYCLAREGSHDVPFSIDIPVGKGAKGSFRSKTAAVRYIVIGSIKLKSANGRCRSIAHFYRHVDLLPYLNPAVVLSSAPKPLLGRASKNLFLGGPGKVHLAVTLHRPSWVAGQRLFVNLRIDNETSKRVKNLSFALMRDVTVFKPRSEVVLDSSDEVANPECYSASTMRKKIAEDSLELGQKGAKGHVTARGWWTGVEPGEGVDISHSLVIPHDALSLPRGRHLEVSYQLRVSASSAMSSDVSVEVPVRIYNFVSLDPPPLKSTISSRPLSTVAIADEAPAIERIRTADALRNLTLAPVQQGKSYDGIALPQQRAPPARNAPPQFGPGASLGAPEDQARRVQHQKSLDFINHAIRSATARRAGSEAVQSMPVQPQGLGIGLDERCPLATEVTRNVQYGYNPQSGANAAEVHDDDDEEEEDYGVGQQTLVLNDDSVADIDYVIGSAHLAGGESSPAFEQRTAFEDDDDARDPYLESDSFDDGNQQGYVPLPSAGPRHLSITASDEDDGATPLAQSPPKFAGDGRRQQDFPGAYTSSPAEEEADAASVSGYASSSASGHAMGSTSPMKLVRTGSDFDSDLGRSATIIKGPSSVARPVSPSKYTPSPKKSALKSRSECSDDAGYTSESSRRRSQYMHSGAPVLRARVDNNQLAGQGAPAAAPHRQGPPTLSHGLPYDREGDLDALSTGYDTSPATSNGITTPTELAYAIPHAATSYEMKPRVMTIPLEDQMRGLGTAMGLPMTTVSASDYLSPDLKPPALPQKDASPRMGISRSSSTHTICGATVVVPSVRDKIAHLESRKKALRDFTAAQQSPLVEPRQQASLHQRMNLPRINSTQSDISSLSSSRLDFVPQQTHNAGSVSSFKAPIFR